MKISFGLILKIILSIWCIFFILFFAMDSHTLKWISKVFLKTISWALWPQHLLTTTFPQYFPNFLRNMMFSCMLGVFQSDPCLEDVPSQILCRGSDMFWVKEMMCSEPPSLFPKIFYFGEYFINSHQIMMACTPQCFNCPFWNVSLQIHWCSGEGAVKPLYSRSCWQAKKNCVSVLDPHGGWRAHHRNAFMTSSSSCLLCFRDLDSLDIKLNRTRAGEWGREAASSEKVYQS